MCPLCARVVILVHGMTRLMNPIKRSQKTHFPSATTWTMDATSPSAKDDKVVAVNINEGGKVHRLIPASVGRSREKRARCGWKAGSAVAKTMFCKRVVAGVLCRKCFREAGSHPRVAEPEDAIEDPD